MKLFLKQIGLMIAIYAMVLTQVGCPFTPENLTEAKNLTSDVAKYSNAGVEITRVLYRAGKIPLALKDDIADGWIGLSDAGIGVETLIANLATQYADTTVPKAEIDRLFAAFDSKVVDQFIAVFSKLKVSGVGSNWGGIVESVKTAVLAASKLFRKRDKTAAKLAAAGV